MMQRLTPCSHPEMYISFTQSNNYMYLNAALGREIQNRYGNVYGINLYLDEDKRLIRIEFDDNNGDYVLSKNNIRGYKVAFSHISRIGLIRKHYNNIVFGDNYIEFEYEVN